MPDPIIPLSAARVLHLAAQGLQHSQRRKATPQDLHATLRRMGLLQIDTISVVARSPYLVLFSRLGEYPAAWLDAALKQRDVFEYWAHEACFVPAEDYGLLRHKMLAPDRLGWKYSLQWQQKHRQDIEQLLQHITLSGPVRSADFARGAKKGNGWWDWKPEKRHLETLFTSGRLMVAERQNFHRVYDLTERVKPGWDDAADTLDKAAAEEMMLRRSCRYLGIFKPEWLADYYRLKRVDAKSLLLRMREKGEIVSVRVDGLDGDCFVHHSLSELLPQAEQGKLQASLTTLLSPFDPVVWDRKRALALFGFDYRLECYTPQEKRRYGYFVLPLLQRGELIGRLDAKMHRQRGVFEIKALYLEDKVRVGSRRTADIQAAINRCARWHGATHVLLDSVPGALSAVWGKGWSLGGEACLTG